MTRISRINQHNLLELWAKSRHTEAMKKFASTRDIIIHTGEFEEAVRFYEEVLALPVTMKSGKLVGFETGSFQLFVDARDPLRMGPVFEFCVADVDKEAEPCGSGMCGGRRRRVSSSLLHQRSARSGF